MPSPTECATHSTEITQPTTALTQRKDTRTVKVEIHDTASTAQYLIQAGNKHAVDILEGISILHTDIVSLAKAEEAILNGIVIDAQDLIQAELDGDVSEEEEVPEVVIDESIPYIEDSAPEIEIEEDISEEVVFERDNVIEGEILEEAVNEEEITPEILYEQEIAPKVVILNGILPQYSTEDSITQPPLATSSGKAYILNENGDEDAISLSSFGSRSESDKKSSNESLQSNARDLENVSKYKFEVFEPQTPGRTVSSIFIVMYSLLGLTILTLIILTVVFDYGMLLLLVMIVIIFCSIVILTNCCAMVYTV